MKHVFLLGASTIPGEFILSRLLSVMIKHLPEIELKVDISDSLKVFEGVRKGNYEIGIIGTRFDSPEIDFTVIIKDDRLVLITPKNHPLASKQSISMTDLKGQNFVTRERSSGTRAAYEKAFKDAGLAQTDLNTVAEVGTTEAVIQAVEGGAGSRCFGTGRERGHRARQYQGVEHPPTQDGPGFFHHYAEGNAAFT